MSNQAGEKNGEILYKIKGTNVLYYSPCPNYRNGMKIEIYLIKDDGQKKVLGYIPKKDIDQAFALQAKADSLKRKEIQKYTASFEAFLKIYSGTREKKDAENQLEAANDFLDKSKAFYYETKEQIELYEKNIEVLIPVFNDVMEQLICFAGCNSAEDFLNNGRELRNLRDRLSNWYTNANLPDSFVEYDYPYLNSNPAKPKMESESKKIKPDNLENRLNDILKKIKNLTPENNLDELCKKCNELESEIKKDKKRGIVYDYKTEESKIHLNKLTDDTKKLSEKVQSCQKEAETYCSAGEKNIRYLFNYRIRWDFVRFLNRALPLVRELAIDGTDKWTQDEYIAFSEKILKLCDDDTPYQQLKFLWVFPFDDVFQHYIPVKLNFLKRSFSWPGLYAVWKNSPDMQPICLINGALGE